MNHPITIRPGDPTYEYLRLLAYQQNTSLNQVVLRIIEREKGETK